MVLFNSYTHNYISLAKEKYINSKNKTFFSKALTYGIALEQLGQQVVHQYVGHEPSGRNFNELVLDHNSKFFVLL